MTNKCVKFHAGSCNNKEVMTNIKVFRAYTNDDDSNNNNAVHDDNRVTAISRCCFFRKSDKLRKGQKCNRDVSLPRLAEFDQTLWLLHQILKSVILRNGGGVLEML